MMLKQEKKIEICEVDYMNRYKIYHLLTAFTELATENASQLGMWHEGMKHQYGWVVAKQTVKLNQPIHVGDHITLSTIIGKGSAAIFPRYYFIEKDGVEIGQCSSVWTLLDLEKRRIVIPKREGLNVPQVTHDIKLETPKMIHPEVDLELKMTRQVLYSDVDLNQHMNNARYIEWALDAIDFDIHQNHFINEVTIQYKKEIRPLESVDLYVGHDGLTYYVEGRDKEGDNYFEIEIVFKKS